MKNTITVILLFLGVFSYSQNKNAKATIEVDGVCMMCKSRIEKACVKTKGVKSAVWDVKTHELDLIFDERKVSLDSIQSRVASAGHDTVKVIAPQDAYDNLHQCCKYRDEAVRDDHK